MEQKQGLFTKEFIALNTIFLFAAAVMAVFFQFQNYLQSLGIAFAWFGFIMGADSLASFVLQPFLSVYLNAKNSRKWLFISISGMAVMLFSYKFALDLPSLIAVRILHGAAFVCLMSAIVAMMVNYIPSEKSGQAFGLVSVVRLVPYSIVPPLLTATNKTPADFQATLIYSSILMIFSLSLAYQIKPSQSVGQDCHSDQHGINMKRLFDNIKDRKIAVLFAVNLLLYSAYTIIFFFIKEYGHRKGIENPGYFFTIATVVMIGIRLIGGTFFDRLNKATITGLSMAGLAVCYALVAHIFSEGMFYVLAFFIGLGWGIVMPLLNALIFDFSPPAFRATNLNLSLVVMQGGFFIGPFIGGIIIGRWGYNTIFYLCALLSFFAAALMHITMKRRSL
ncbi:MAG: MFS transporter [Proteobacteria bacterium]|nr:MFS transporter [Pseudomonadota bacterium]